MKRILLLLLLLLLLALPPAAHSQPRGGIYIWGNTINSRTLGAIGSTMLVGPFRTWQSCLGFMALMGRENAGLVFIGTVVRDVISRFACRQYDSQGNEVQSAGGGSGEVSDSGWVAGGVNSEGYLFAIGPVRTQESCRSLLGVMYREGAGFAYIGISKIIVQAILPSSLSCVYTKP